MILLFLGLSFAVFVMVIALNPNFWQGYRNSRFIDEYLMEDVMSDDEKNLETSK